MRVIITGGTGLIGSKLAASLAADDYEVIVLSRSPAQHTYPPGVRGERWDARTADGWGHLADGASAIVNLAGENLAGTGLIPSRWTAKRKQSILNSRLNIGKAVTEAIRAAGTKPGVLIQASASGFYGSQGDEILTEASPAGDDFQATVARQWEASTAEVETMGVRRVVTRSGVVLSNEGGAFPIMALPFKLFIGGPLGSGKQWLSWIHMSDEVRAIRFLLENEAARGAFNLSTPEPVTNKTFGRVIGNVLGRPSFVPVPAFALRLALGEVSTMVLDGRRMMPQRLQELGFTFLFPTLRAALIDLLKKGEPKGREA